MTSHFLHVTYRPILANVWRVIGIEEAAHERQYRASTVSAIALPSAHVCGWLFVASKV